MRTREEVTCCVLEDPCYPALKSHLLAATGLAYYADKDRELASRIGLRLAETSMVNCRDYLQLLQSDEGGEAELENILQYLTIGETYFFRHTQLFQALREVVLPDLIQRNRMTRHLRIWSAGCSLGAEPYSVAIVLKRQLKHLTAGWDIQILGTDVNRSFLARARRGEFDAWAFRSVSDTMKQTCFARHGQSFVIAPDIKSCVSFACHNLIKDPFPSVPHNLFDFDLILCRNVIIYFSPELIGPTVQGFYNSLVPFGWLLVGHAEPNPDRFRAFRHVSLEGVTVYQKCEAPDLSPERPARYPDCEAVVRPAARASSSGAAPPDCAGTTAPAKTPSPSIRPAVPWLPPVRPSVDPQAAEDPPAQPGAGISAELAHIRALADQGQLEVAARHCQQLAEDHQLDPVVRFYQALILNQLGLGAEAEETLRRVIYLDRRYVMAHFHLGLLLHERRRNREAARCFHNVLALLSSHDEAQIVFCSDELTAADLRELALGRLQTMPTKCE